MFMSLVYSSILFVDVNECTQNICENGATCNNFDGGYSCNCAFGWSGDHCNIGKYLRQKTIRIVIRFDIIAYYCFDKYQHCLSILRF